MSDTTEFIDVAVDSIDSKHYERALAIAAVAQAVSLAAIAESLARIADSLNSIDNHTAAI